MRLVRALGSYGGGAAVRGNAEAGGLTTSKTPLQVVHCAGQVAAT
jgi:hypothetical protein